MYTVRCTLYSKQSISWVQKCVYSITVRSNYNSPQIVYSNTFYRVYVTTLCNKYWWDLNAKYQLANRNKLLQNSYAAAFANEKLIIYSIYDIILLTVIIMYTQIAFM